RCSRAKPRRRRHRPLRRRAGPLRSLATSSLAAWRALRRVRAAPKPGGVVVVRRLVRPRHGEAARPLVLRVAGPAAAEARMAVGIRSLVDPFVQVADEIEDAVRRHTSRERPCAREAVGHLIELGVVEVLVGELEEVLPVREGYETPFPLVA